MRKKVALIVVLFDKREHQARKLLRPFHVHQVSDIVDDRSPRARNSRLDRIIIAFVPEALGLRGLLCLRRVVTLAIDCRHFPAHRPQVRRKLAAMMN